MNKGGRTHLVEQRNGDSSSICVRTADNWPMMSCEFSSAPKSEHLDLKN